MAGRTAAEAGTDVEEGALPAVLAHIDGSELFLTHEYERHVKVDIPVSGGQFQFQARLEAAEMRRGGRAPTTPPPPSPLRLLTNLRGRCGRRRR